MSADIESLMRRASLALTLPVVLRGCLVAALAALRIRVVRLRS